MTERKRLSEFEILAYADGRLDHAPAQRAEVEAALAESPEDQARVEAYRAQSEALRAAYGERIGEPVPERLRAVLEERGRRRQRMPAMAAAASVAMALLAGAAGWTIAQWQASPGGSAQALLEDSYRDFVEAPSVRDTAPSERIGPVSEERTVAGLGPGGSGGALSNLSKEISLTLHVPDLSDRGYEIVSKETIARGGSETVRITYANGEGDSFGLYLRPRWEEREASLNIDRRGEVSLGYWMDGPLAAAVASRQPPAQTKELAEAVLTEMERSAPESPEIRLPRQIEQEASMQKAPLELGASAPIADTPTRPEPQRGGNGVSGGSNGGR